MRLFLVHIVILLFASLNLAGKGLLLNFNQDCSKYKQLFDEANTATSSSSSHGSKNNDTSFYNNLDDLLNGIDSTGTQTSSSTSYFSTTGGNNISTNKSNIQTQQNFLEDAKKIVNSTNNDIWLSDYHTLKSSYI